MDYTLILLGLIAAETTFLTASHVLKLRRSAGRLVFVDTSVLIDGRIISIAEAGFIPGTLAIPRSVVGELQFLADNGDADKRSRARHGLDVIKELQAMSTVKTVLFADSVRAEEGVDNRLLTLTKRHSGILCTIDFNLNKVAQVEGIFVLNINELAKSLRMAYLPGEKTVLELTQKGNDGHQAVGHLSDGTMVVVEGAHKLIGKSAEVEFIRSLQTAAGKMMFAKLANSALAEMPISRHPKSQKQQAQKQPRPPKTPQDSQQPAQQPKPAEQPFAKQPRSDEPRAQRAPRPPRAARPYQQRSNQRRTNEDSLVELANNQ